MTPEEAKQKASEWQLEAGGELLPKMTANELAGMVNEAILESSAHAELLEIHKIGMCIACCEPVFDTDTMTVRMVKEMAHRINKMSANAELTRLPACGQSGEPKANES